MIKKYLMSLEERMIHIEDKLNEALSNDMNDFCFDQKWGGRTYAQYGDDIIIINIFNNLNIEKFSYIDIGAHHPYKISNTALLYEYGYRGINIEANPNLIEAFYKMRPQDKNLNVGVGVSECELPFYMIDDYSGRNSFDKVTVENFCKKCPEFSISEIRNIKVLPLYSIIDKYCDGKFPEFMSIDIEGIGYEVLSSLKKDNSPIVIDVEVNTMSNIDDNAMVVMLKDKGYEPYFKCHANLIFVRMDYYIKLKM